MQITNGTKIVVDGKPHWLGVERRRYGTGASSRTYTWVYLFPHGINGERVAMGDAWPCINPKRSEVEAAIRHHVGG